MSEAPACVDCGTAVARNGDTGRRSKRCEECKRSADRESDRRYYEANREKRREKNRRYYEANREKERERVRRWREANPEKRQSRWQQWSEANPEKNREGKRQWRRANPEKDRAWRRRWQEANPEKNRVRSSARRARKRNAPVVELVVPATVFERDKWLCHICDQAVEPERKYPDPLGASLDHVIPLAKGGDHSYANTALAHLRCNLSKGARIIGQIAQ